VARVCDICKKGLMFGKNVSHSKRSTNRKWVPNIQKVRAIIDGKTKTIKVCTRCIRSGKVQRAL
jgi:large subunit ribosomal protein L28